MHTVRQHMDSVYGNDIRLVDLMDLERPLLIRYAYSLSQH